MLLSDLFASKSRIAAHPIFKDACAIWDFTRESGDLCIDCSVVDRPYHGTITQTSGTGTISRVASKYGKGVFNDTATSDARIDLGSITSTDLLSGYPTQAITVFALIEWNDIVDSSTFPRLIDKSDGGNGANGWGFYYRNTDVCYAACDGGFALISSSLDASGNEGFVTVGMSYEPSSYRLFENGALQGSAAGLSTSFPVDTKNAAISNWNHSTARTFDSPIYLIAAWPRILSDAEHARLHHEAMNYGFRYTIPIRFPIPTAGGGPSWDNTINEIASPGAVNEITNANIQSVNEI